MNELLPPPQGESPHVAKGGDVRLNQVSAFHPSDHCANVEGERKAQFREFEAGGF